jgi:hypothetical protein
MASVTKIPTSFHQLPVPEFPPVQKKLPIVREHVEPFVLHDYMQTKSLANKIEQPLPRAKFLTAVTTAMLLKTKDPAKTLEQ